MAVATSPEPLLKSQPDVNKLNGFTNPTVTVTKHKAARGTPGLSVVPSQMMKAAQILELQATLPVHNGPGYYKFTVADTLGGDSESWMVALGAEQQEISPMPNPPGFPPVNPSAPPFTAAPLDPETKQIMPGWFYNESTQLLMTPWREAVQWRQGEPLPKPPTPAAGAPHLAVVPPNANPWSWPPQPPQSSWGTGWGNFPVTSSDSDEIKALRERIAQQDRKAEMDELRSEQRRQADEQKRRDEERDRRNEAMFEKLTAALTTKPSGPSDNELRLQRETEAAQRRAEEAERRQAEERRETQRREEQRAADERHREEMRMMRDEIKSNKPDPLSPMLGMFTSLISNIQAASTENIRAIKETVAQGTASAERFMMHPAQILDMVRTEKAGGAEMAATVLNTSKEMIGMQREMFTNMMDLSSNSGQPAWVGLASEAMQKVGAIGQALAERNAQQAAQPQYVPPPQPVRRQAPPRQQTVQVQQTTGVPQPQIPRVPRQQVPPANAARPGYVDTGGRPEGTNFDAKTEEFVLADGMRIKQSAVEKEGWVVAIREAIRARGMQSPVAVSEPALDGMNGAAPAVNGAAGPVNGAAPPVNKGGRKKRAVVTAVPPAPEPHEEEVEVLPPASTMPPPANPQGYTLAEMQAADPDAVLQAISAFTDEILFGDLWQYVPQLRQSRDPQQVVQAVLQGQAFLRNSGKSAPAMDLLAAEQLGPFVERLLPEASQEFGQAVFETLAEAMGLSSGDAA